MALTNEAYLKTQSRLLTLSLRKAIVSQSPDERQGARWMNNESENNAA